MIVTRHIRKWNMLRIDQTERDYLYQGIPRKVRPRWVARLVTW